MRPRNTNALRNRSVVPVSCNMVAEGGIAATRIHSESEAAIC